MPDLQLPRVRDARADRPPSIVSCLTASRNFEALVNELIKHNKHFTMLSYPNRSHGIFEGPGTRRHLYTEMTRYLNEHMPAGGVAQDVSLD